jgi:hypothetical protein
MDASKGLRGIQVKMGFIVESALMLKGTRAMGEVLRGIKGVGVMKKDSMTRRFDVALAELWPKFL